MTSAYSQLFPELAVIGGQWAERDRESEPHAAGLPLFWEGRGRRGSSGQKNPG